jgi:hypothetical protein
VKRSRYSDPEFWVEACDRAIKTAAASLVALFGTNVTSITDVNWLQALSISALSAFVSLLSSIATKKELQ